MKVTWFNSVWESDKPIVKELQEVLMDIQNGKYKDSVNKVRTSTTKEDSDIYKKKLSGVCFTGIFKHREIDGLLEHNGLAIMDFDKIDNLIETSSRLKNDNYIHALWISASGTGLKALIKIPVCQNDEDYKKYYESLLDKYQFAQADNKTKDISRFCFDSYSPDLWINIKSEIYTTKKEEIKDIFKDLPSIDYSLTESEIIEKIEKWINTKESFIEGNRNSFLFKFQSALNRFGIPKQTSLYYCLSNYNLDEAEINQTNKSAYRDTSRFGIAKFNNKKEYVKTIKDLRDGKDRTEIKIKLEQSGLNSEIAEEILNQAENKINEKLEVFWSTITDSKDNVKIRFEPRKYKYWLEGNGFFRYKFSKGQYILVKIQDNIVREIFTPDLKSFVFSFIDSLPFEFDMINRESLYNFIFTKQHTFFSPDTVETLSEMPINFNTDAEGYLFLYYKNCCLKISESGIEKINYSNLSGYVWESQIIDRFYSISNGKSDYETFLRNVIGNDENNFQSLQTIIGFILHEHKNRAFCPAIVLNDAKLGDDANGGTGKGIFAETFKHFKKMETFDGKSWSIDKNFAFQRVDLDTKLIFIDDIQKNFDFEKLFSIITEGIPVEKKGKDEFFIPFNIAPKIILATNYALSGSGNSHERRKIEFEFCNYYSRQFTPLHEFGKLLFSGWSEEEWSVFDNFIIRCIEKYMISGIYSPTSKNLVLKKLISNTCQEFVEWVDEAISINQKYHITHKLDQFNNEMKYKTTMKSFNKWLKNYSEYKSLEYFTSREGVNQEFYFILKDSNFVSDIPF